MSESDDGGFVFGPPPELLEQQRQQYEAMRAHNEANVRRQDAFVESLDEEQLRMLRSLIAAAVDNPPFGSYLVGWMASILKYKYNVCQYCGEHHITLDDILTAHPDPENN